MNRIVKNSLIVLIPSTLMFVTGWKLGSLQGAGVSSQLLEAGKSNIIVNELTLLRDKKIDELITLKEIELDGSLLSHSVYLEDNNGWIIYPFNKMYEPILDDSLSKSISYRKKYPRNESNIEIRKEMVEVYKRVDALLEEK